MNNYLSDAKVNALLAMAAKSLGRSPEDLKANLASGNVDGVLSGMHADQKSKITSLLNNPTALEALLKNEQVKKLLGG